MDKHAENKGVFESFRGRMPDEELDALTSYVEECREEFKETGKLSDLIGLKTFGVTDEGVQAAISIGANLVRQGHLLKAAQYFEGLAQIEPVNAEVSFWMGLTAHKLKNYDLAVFLYQQAIVFGHEDGCAQLFCGECFLLLGDKAKGLELLGEGLKLAAKNPRLRVQAQRAHQLVLSQQEKAPHGG